MDRLHINHFRKMIRPYNDTAKQFTWRCDPKDKSVTEICPDKKDYRTKWQTSMHIIPLVFLILDMLVNRIQIPPMAFFMQPIILIVFVIYTILLEAVTSVPANFEHLNYFCKGSVSNLYSQDYNIYKSYSVPKSCEALKMNNGTELFSRFDNKQLGC